MRALVLGSGATIWDDLRAYGPPDGLVIAVNDMIWAYPHRIDHAVTLHPENLPVWMERRERRGHEMGFPVWSNKPGALVTRDVRSWGKGSSGMLGVTVAVKLADEVVLCGIPMDPRPHFHNDRTWTGSVVHGRAWTENVERMRGRVWSMSGWTRELLGFPPWLQDAQGAA